MPRRRSPPPASRPATIDTVGLFGTPTNNWLVCEQVPAGGESPEKGTAVDLTADSKGVLAQV